MLGGVLSLKPPVTDLHFLNLLPACVGLRQLLQEYGADQVGEDCVDGDVTDGESLSVRPGLGSNFGGASERSGSKHCFYTHTSQCRE